MYHLYNRVSKKSGRLDLTRRVPWWQENQRLTLLWSWRLFLQVWPLTCERELISCVYCLPIAYSDSQPFWCEEFCSCDDLHFNHPPDGIFYPVIISKELNLILLSWIWLLTCPVVSFVHSTDIIKCYTRMLTENRYNLVGLLGYNSCPINRIIKNYKKSN